MRTMEKKIAKLREAMAVRYALHDRVGSLALSRQLDRLILREQRAQWVHHCRKMEHARIPRP